MTADELKKIADELRNDKNLDIYSTGTLPIDVMLSKQKKTCIYLTKVFVGMIEEFPG